LKSWYVELMISDDLSKKIKQWEISTGKDSEDLINQLLEEYFNEK
jgi:hypothetical protein